MSRVPSRAAQRALATLRPGSIRTAGGMTSARHGCLNLANTLEYRKSGEPVEWLQAYSDLVWLAEHSDLLPRAAARQLARREPAHRKAAQVALERSKTVREIVYRIGSAIAEGEKPTVDDVRQLSDGWHRAARHIELVAEPGGVIRRFDPGDADFDAAWWPFVWDAVTLFTSDERFRLKECPGDGCGWLFLDTSKNRSRVWCSMAECGNRAKVQRFYRRHARHQ